MCLYVCVCIYEVQYKDIYLGNILNGLYAPCPIKANIHKIGKYTPAKVACKVYLHNNKTKRKEKKKEERKQKRDSRM